jgi:hypothetical protein
MPRNVCCILLVVAATIVSSCGDDESGLKCKSGQFYLDGEEFTSCDQCAESDDCGFEANITQLCSYPGGVQRCVESSGTVKAHCAGETAKLLISDGEYSCGK